MAWPLQIKLTKNNYPMSVVQRVAYALAGELSIIIESSKSDSLTLNIQPAIIASDQGINAIRPDEAGEIVIRMLNDFVLRDRINEETKGLREIIASAALQEAGTRS